MLSRLGREDPELEWVERIVREGNGADRQRASEPGLLRYLARPLHGRYGAGTIPSLAGELPPAALATRLLARRSMIE